MKLILVGLILVIALQLFYFFFNNSSGIKSLAGGVFKETLIGGGNIVNASNIATVANIAKKSSFLTNITKCNNIISDII